MTTLLTEQTSLEFSHIRLAEKIPVQCWALDVFHIWFHSWKWAPRHHYSPDISGLTHEVMSSCCPAVWFDERLVMHIKWFSIIRLKCLIQSSYWVRFFIFKAEWVAILCITSFSGLIICSQWFYLLLRENRLFKAHWKWMFLILHRNHNWAWTLLWGGQEKEVVLYPVTNFG